MVDRIPTPDAPEPRRRRSQRVILSMSVTVRSMDKTSDAPFEEEAHTLVVNAHGALLSLANPVKKGQNLRLTNRATHLEQKCQVTYLGPVSGNKTQVGIEFTEPSPDFWRIAFPPEDWNQPEHHPATKSE